MRPQSVDPEVWKVSLARNAMAAFVAYTYPKYIMGWCHLEICKRLDRFLEAVREKQSPRLMISMPPRHGKTELASRRFPAYAFGRYPDMEIIATSYSDSLASRINRDVQRIIDKEQYYRIFPGTELPGKNAKADAQYSYLRNNDIFEIINHTGSYRSAGVGSGINGMGCDIGIIDDPYKSRADAESQTKRDSVYDWYTSTLYNRLSPGGGLLIIATRWHQDDLMGRLLEKAKTDGDEWDLINFPAIAEEDEPYRNKGDALHPERYPLEELIRKKSAIGTRDWESLYQQHPTPGQGILFKREHFKYFETHEADGDRTYALQGDAGTSLAPASLCKVFQTCDVAGTISDSADYFVLSTFALTPDNNLLVLDVFRLKIEGPDQPRLIRQQAQKWKPLMIGVESKNMGLTLFQTLRREALPIVELKPGSQDKYTRAMPAAARYSTGSIYHSLNAPWLEEYESELSAFPNGAHDDQVDTVAYAVLMMVWGYLSADLDNSDRALVIG